MYKKSVIRTLLFSSIIIGVPGLINYIVDPFQQYRKPWYNPYFPPQIERYLNPGLVKNYDYDSILIGTSHVETFNLNDLRNIFKLSSPIKLSIQGGSAFEQALTLKTALKHNSKVKHVFFGLDFWSFRGPPSRLARGKGSLPKYLYDDFLLNDVSYLLNYDTLKESFDALERSSKKNDDDPWYSYDTMYTWSCWYKNSDFSSKKILKMWKDDLKKRKTPPQWISDAEYTVLKKSFDTNFKPIFDKYKNVKFVVFFPPYSVLAYKRTKITGWMKDSLEFKRYLVYSTKDLHNVQFFDFQIAQNVTHDLNNFIDFSHHSEKINRWILEQIKANNYVVDESNIEQNIETLIKQTNDWRIDVKQVMK